MLFPYIKTNVLFTFSQKEMKSPFQTKSKNVSKMSWSKMLGLNEKLHFSFSTIPINQNASFQSKLNVVLCHYSSINTVHHFWFGWNFALLVYPLTQYVNFGLNCCLLWNNFASRRVFEIFIYDFDVFL